MKISLIKNICRSAAAATLLGLMAGCADHFNPNDIPTPPAAGEEEEDTPPREVANIYIDIPGEPDLEDVFTKETYLDAEVTIETFGDEPSTQTLSASVKGRGNSTWRYPKKPYRLKFAKKQSLFGMGAAKSYVLLANYIDPTHMRNAVALRAAQMLEMPFTCHFEPVRVYFNGKLRGAYNLTEKIGIGAASVDIDENEGFLFELDTNFDEPYQFTSRMFRLPVMIKDPDLGELAAKQGRDAEAIRKELYQRFWDIEEKIYAGEAWEVVDLDSFVDYMLVYNLTGNCEIDHPKSLYLYVRSADDKLHFGPVWDFDWAYTYYAGTETGSPEVGIVSHPFLRRLVNTPGFAERYAERWDYFLRELWPELQRFIDTYAAEIRGLAAEDGELWPDEPGRRESSLQHALKVEALKQWLRARVEHISSAPLFGLLETQE